MGPRLSSVRLLLFLLHCMPSSGRNRKAVCDMESGEDRARVVVAVDFGTTFSGFAYARTSDPDDVFKVYEWPDAAKVSATPYCKTQTSLFYAPSRGDAPFELVDWGWSSLVSYTEAARAFAKSEAPPISGEIGSGSPARRFPSMKSRLAYLAGFSLLAKHFTEGHQKSEDRSANLHAGVFATQFKLFLAPNSDQKRFLPKLPIGLTVEQMVVDYLRCLAGFIMSELQFNYGKHVSMKDVQWCLTVPAIWDESAKQAMKLCAEKAGMVQGSCSPGSTAGSPFPLDIILEPEAASVYCQRKSKGLKLRKGDKMLVADVGGGTIDLVVHEKAEADPESVRVHEVVSSYGDVGGGTFVDAEFFRYVGRKIGCFEEFARTNKSIVLTIFQWWQGVKAGFDGSKEYSAELTLPKKLRKAWEKHEQSQHQANGNVDEDYYEELRLESSEMKAIFDTEVEKVISLIDKQIKGIRVLMVVGGFSASPYLRSRIKQAFEKKVEEIVIPEEPGGAICHGALQLHLTKDVIQSRIAKRTYGIRFNRAPQKGDPSDLKFKNDDGQWRCRDCIDVFVRAGDRVPLNASITRTYVPSAHGQRKIGMRLLTSPDMFPKYLRDKGVHKEGCFYMDTSTDLHLDKDRRVRATMVFGSSLLLVSAERVNFGKPGKEKGLWVTFQQG